MIPYIYEYLIAGDNNLAFNLLGQPNKFLIDTELPANSPRIHQAKKAFNI